MSLADGILAQEGKCVVDLDGRALHRRRDLTALVAVMIGYVSLAIGADATAPLLVVGACNQRGLRRQAGCLGHDYCLAALLLSVIALLRVLCELSHGLYCALLSLVCQRL